MKARAYADPLSPTGLLTTSSQTLAESLNALSTTIPPSRIFYFQISDACRPPSPASLKATASEMGIPPLYAWSNFYRPLPFQKENGAYLEDAVVQICKAVLRTGWRGPWSYEVFYKEGMEKDDEGVPRKWTEDAMKCHQRILEEVDREE